MTDQSDHQPEFHRRARQAGPLASTRAPGGPRIRARASRGHAPRASILVIGVVAALVAVSCSSSSSSPGSSPATTGAAQTTSSKVTGPTSSATSPDGKVTLTTLSAPAPYVSGGQVLVRVRVKGATTHAPASPPGLKVTAGGQDVTKDLDRTEPATTLPAGSAGGPDHGLVGEHQGGGLGRWLLGVADGGEPLGSTARSSPGRARPPSPAPPRRPGWVRPARRTAPCPPRSPGTT